MKLSALDLGRLSEMARSAQDPPLPNDLLVRLRRASNPELGALVQDFGRFFSLREIRQLLLNPFVDADILHEMAMIRHVVASQSVRAALARHFRAPEPLAMRFVPDLFWRDLLEITADFRIRQSVRKVAERYLIERLPRLTVGEKIALARRATPSTGRQLVRTAELPVVAALLENPRMTEQALMPLLTDQGASPRALRIVAAHERWGTRYEVRLALCRNPQTAFGDIFRLLPQLTSDDLAGVAGVSKHSSVVLGRVEEILQRKHRPKPMQTPLLVESEASDLEGDSSVDMEDCSGPLDTQDSDTLE